MASVSGVFFIGAVFTSILTVSIEAQCALPATWQPNIYYFGYGDTLLPKFLFMNQTALYDLSSGFLAVCNAFNETAGIVSLTQTEGDITEQYCQEIMAAKNVLFYRKSSATMQANPLGLEECVTSLGERSQFKAYILFVDGGFPTDNWGTSIIPAGTYSFTYSSGSNENCTDTSATLTIVGNVWTASSTCITGAQSYTNPMAGELLAVDGLPDVDLSVVSTSPFSGMLVIAMPFPQSTIFLVDYKFILVRYQAVTRTDQTSYLSLLFTTDEAADPTGYLSENDIPVAVQSSRVKATLTSSECSTSQCMNGGTCIQQWLGFKCSCAPGFEGSQCQTNIDECIPNPCENGGTCRDQVNGYTCECSADYDGPKCQFENACGANNPCMNGATCLTVADGTSQVALCRCPKSYFGKVCEYYDLCADEPCENGGTCFQKNNRTDFYCLCPFGLSGKRCEINNGTTCEAVRCVNGVCLNNDVGPYCECDIFYDGDLCDELSDWFIVALVLLILFVLIIIILLIVCCCFCCCGWRPNSTANYETMNNSESSFKVGPPASNPGTVEFNFSPASPYYGIQMLGSSKK